MAEVRLRRKALRRRAAREWKRVGKGNQKEKTGHQMQHSQCHPASHLCSDQEEGNRRSQSLAARHVSVISEIRRWREGDKPGLQREALEEEEEEIKTGRRKRRARRMR